MDSKEFLNKLQDIEEYYDSKKLTNDLIVN